MPTEIASPAPEISSNVQITPGLSRRWRACAITALVLAALSMFTVGKSPFFDPDEFNYITAARNMVEGGDWITPHFNGAPRIYKPVLVYWIIAAAYEIFGVHVVVARLCSAAGAAVGVAGVWLIARHLLGAGQAWLAALFAAGHLTLVQITRFATTDTTLWAFCTLSTYGYVRLAFATGSETSARESSPLDPRPGSARWAYLFFAAMALALLTKGPVALVWCLTPVLWSLLRRDWRTLRAMRWISGTALMLLIVAPWASIFIARNLYSFREVLLDPSSPESYEQFSAVVLNPIKMLGVFAQLFPSILSWLPVIFFAVIDHRAWASRTRCARFLFFWAIVLLVILGLAERKSFRYMLPLIAPTSLLLAGWFSAACQRPGLAKALGDAVIAWGVAALVLAVPIVIVICRTRSIDTSALWANVALELVMGAVCISLSKRPWMQQIAPAVVVIWLYAVGSLTNVTVDTLWKPSIASLAPKVRQIVPPEQRLQLCGNLTPRYLAFDAHRFYKENRTIPEFVQAIQTAPACLARESDWQQVPPAERAQFKVVGTAMVLREPARNFDLDKDVETVLLLQRVPASTRSAAR